MKHPNLANALTRSALIGAMVGIALPLAGLALLYLVGRFGVPAP